MLQTSSRREVILYLRELAGVTILAKSLDGVMSYMSCRSPPAWLQYLPSNVSYTGKRTPLFGLTLSLHSGEGNHAKIVIFVGLGCDFSPMR